MTPFFSITVVTHNSQDFLSENLSFLESQKNRNFELILVDSGSHATRYLHELSHCSFPLIKHISEENLGFAKANNLGITFVSPQSTHIIFLNPDAFLPEFFLSRLEELVRTPGTPAVISPKLLRYDIEKKEPTTVIDSVGIGRTFYGRWFDIGQETVDVGQFESRRDVTAICGALFIVKKEAVDEVIAKRGSFFDETLFMYKEDIEVSRFLIKIGYQLVYVPDLVAYHCRGWQSRPRMSRKAKLLSARNDVVVALRYSWRSLPFALAKFCYVYLVEQFFSRK